MTLPLLVENVDLLSLDAGNTVIFLDHDRLSKLLLLHGQTVSPPALIEAEGEAKRLHEQGKLAFVTWRRADLPAARGWGANVATILMRSGVPVERVPDILGSIWDEHVRLNLWSLVPEGLHEALRSLRRVGVRVVVVSNSEGMLTGLFKQVGISDLFDAVVDSGLVGVEKPSPLIFDHALRPYNVLPERALHLGDNYATDIVGARQASMRAALLDPFNHYAGLHADVPRVPSVAAVALAILESRSRGAEESASLRFTESGERS